jgi:hypothetical protein
MFPFKILDFDKKRSTHPKRQCTQDVKSTHRIGEGVVELFAGLQGQALEQLVKSVALANHVGVAENVAQFERLLHLPSHDRIESELKKVGVGVGPEHEGRV